MAPINPIQFNSLLVALLCALRFCCLDSELIGVQNVVLVRNFQSGLTNSGLYPIKKFQRRISLYARIDQINHLRDLFKLLRLANSSVE